MCLNNGEIMGIHLQQQTACKKCQGPLLLPLKSLFKIHCMPEWFIDFSKFKRSLYCNFNSEGVPKKKKKKFHIVHVCHLIASEWLFRQTFCKQLLNHKYVSILYSILFLNKEPVHFGESETLLNQSGKLLNSSNSLTEYQLVMQVFLFNSLHLGTI